MNKKRGQIERIPAWQHLGGKEGTPLYERLAEQIRQSIREGTWFEGMRLPSKRRLAASLGLSLTTISSAYDTLVAEGYLVAYPRSGYAVGPLAELYLRMPAKEKKILPEPEEENPEPAWRYDFGPHGIDKSLFPEKSVKRIYRKIIDEGALSDEPHRRGLFSLRKELAGYLLSSQDIRISPSDIVISYGIQGLYRFLFDLLPMDAVFSVEDPGYPSLARTLQRSGKKYYPLLLADEGISVRDLEKNRVDIASLTPMHQFPTGIEYSGTARMRLLEWAYREKGRYLIEDDYDSAFRSYSSVESLRKLDGRGERVLYIGSFSRSWSPGLRISYIVLTPDLSRKAKEMGIPSISPVPLMEQAFLAELIRSNTFERHLNRAARLYRKKCRLLIEALEASSLPWRIHQAGSGLHFIAELPEESYAPSFCARAALLGLHIKSIQEYCHHSSRPRDILIGYGGIPVEEIPSAVEALEEAWRLFKTN